MESSRHHPGATGSTRRSTAVMRLYSLDQLVWLKLPGGRQCSHAVRGGGEGTPFLTGQHTLSSNLGNTRRLGTLPPGRGLAGGDEAGPR